MGEPAGASKASAEASETGELVAISHAEQTEHGSVINSCRGLVFRESVHQNPKIPPSLFAKLLSAFFLSFERRKAASGFEFGGTLFRCKKRPRAAVLFLIKEGSFSGQQFCKH